MQVLDDIKKFVEIAFFGRIMFYSCTYFVLQNTTYFIDKLTPHTPYFFRVFAENKVGLSQSCQTEDVTVTTEPKPSALNRTLSFDSDGRSHDWLNMYNPFSLFKY